MKKLIKEHWKDYFRSTLVTFLAGAVTALLPLVDALPMDSLGDGVWLVLVFAAIRAGTRAVMQKFLNWHKKR